MTTSESQGTTGSGVRMKSVIAQLGERQQVPGKFPPIDRTAPKPQAVGKALAPANGSATSPGRVPVKPPPATSKPIVAALNSPSTSTGSAKRPPSAGPKPVTPHGTSAAQTAVPQELISAARLKPTVAAKHPSATSPSSPPTTSPADDETPVPPWQNLLKKKTVPVPTTAKEQNSLNIVEQKSSPTPTSATTTKETGESLARASSPVADDKTTEQQSPEETSNRAAKVRNLKQAFEGGLQATGDSAGSSASNNAAESGRSSTLKKVTEPTTTPNTTSVVAEPQTVVNKPASTATRPSDHTTPPPRPVSVRTKPDLTTSTAVKPPARQPASVSDSQKSSGKTDILIGADGRQYRRLAPPNDPQSRPPRKPAKPPVVDLSRYRSCSGVIEDDEDETYDDATGMTQLIDNGPMLRGSGAAGRQTVMSVVSQISEFTEEEEERGGRMWNSGSGGALPVSQSSDDVYDDVAATGTGTVAAEVEYEYDDVYQELD